MRVQICISRKENANLHPHSHKPGVKNPRPRNHPSIWFPLPFQVPESEPQARTGSFSPNLRVQMSPIIDSLKSRYCWSAASSFALWPQIRHEWDSRKQTRCFLTLLDKTDEIYVCHDIIHKEATYSSTCIRIILSIILKYYVYCHEIFNIISCQHDQTWPVIQIILWGILWR